MCKPAAFLTYRLAIWSKTLLISKRFIGKLVVRTDVSISEINEQKACNYVWRESSSYIFQVFRYSIIPIISKFARKPCKSVEYNFREIEKNKRKSAEKNSLVAATSEWTMANAERADVVHENSTSVSRCQHATFKDLKRLALTWVCLCRWFLFFFVRMIFAEAS